MCVVIVPTFMVKKHILSIFSIDLFLFSEFYYFLLPAAINSPPFFHFKTFYLTLWLKKKKHVSIARIRPRSGAAWRARHQGNWASWLLSASRRFRKKDWVGSFMWFHDIELDPPMKTFCSKLRKVFATQIHIEYYWFCPIIYPIS